MSKTCIFVKNAFLFVLFTMIVKNVVPLFSFSSIYFYFCLKKKKLVISNHFGIVRLKTQSEKYMALKDEISRGIMRLRYMPQSQTIKKLETKRISLKRVSQRFVESCEFSPGTPVSTHKES